MNDSISKGEIIHAVNAEVNKPKKVRYKLHTPIEEVVIEFDEKEEVTSIDHILSDSIKAWTGEDMGKTEPSDLMSHEEAWNTIESDLISRADAVKEFTAIIEQIESTEGIEVIDRVAYKSVEDYVEQALSIVPSADRPTEDYSDLPDIPRAYYEKIVGNMSHEINMLKEQLESADAESDDLIIKGAKGIKDGLYNITDGKLFKYKAKGGTVRAYKLVPSVSAERVGEWIFKDNDGGFAGEYYCGNCGKRAEVNLYGEWILSNYCPNCGAKMKGGAE